MGHLPYGRQEISDGDVAAVTKALRAPMITQGPAVESFERALVEYTGARYAVVFSSCTAALHGAYAAAGIGPGHSVLTSPITFVATANASLYLGGSVRFADVDPWSALMDPNSADDRADDSIRVVAPVHFGGEVADVEGLAAVAAARKWLVVEDAAHAIGAGYRSSDGTEHVVGACDHSDLCCFSFHPVKQMTTGEGGAVTTNDETAWRRLRRFRSHGITREAQLLSLDEGPWYYEQLELGYNYRLTDVQSALGLSQLSRLSGWIRDRRQLAQRYEKRLEGLAGVRPLRRPAWSHGAHHLFVVRVPAERRRAIYESMVRADIGVNVHYIPVYRQPVYRQAGFEGLRLPGAEEYYQSALTLPLFPSMTERDVDRVVAALQTALGPTDP